MIVSIMQPYFFPYIGYFQLIMTSDVFVAHDTAQYIKGGWINRNLVLDSKGEPSWITFPVAAADHRLEIRQRKYLQGGADRLLRRIEGGYRAAPHFKTIFPLLCELMRISEPNVAAFNMHVIAKITSYLGMRKQLLLASELATTPGLKGEAKVIDICRSVGADAYVNPIGGRHLYRSDEFRRHGLSLSFIETTTEPPEGLGVHLSIIHSLMNFGVEGFDCLLRQYRTIGV